MKNMGIKIAEKRKDLGMTQTEFADRLHVTRQSVSRWEQGSVLPDIEKIGEIAEILGVSCDYLLRDDAAEDGGARRASGASRLLANAAGKKVRLSFFDGEADVDLYDAACTVEGFEGNWIRVSAETKEGRVEKLLPVSSVLSLTFEKEAED